MTTYFVFYLRIKSTQHCECPIPIHYFFRYVLPSIGLFSKKVYYFTLLVLPIE